jgi:hypothetical protein
MPSVVVRIQIRRRPDNSPAWLDRKFAARIEARALLATVGKNGDTIETLRELISVPPDIEALLRAFARTHPAEGGEIEIGLRFRKRVLEEFEALLGG